MAEAVSSPDIASAIIFGAVRGVGPSRRIAAGAYCRSHPVPITVTPRAWDDTGVAQPESPAPLWNPRGYGNNAWGHVKGFAR
jgi:hypothetical protein